MYNNGIILICVFIYIYNIGDIIIYYKNVYLSILINALTEFIFIKRVTIILRYSGSLYDKNLF